ncbi:MAG: protein Rep, partial [Actinobacteria bacterium]|nr:protein Rep [Actinomycetota bacterium]
EFKKFIKRLKYKYGDFKYLAVVEFQKRGAIHYHMLSDFSYIEQADLEKIWSNGFVWIRDLITANKGKPVDNVGAYIVKYMNKNIIDKRLMGKKAYFTSKNLKRPEIIYEDMSLIDCFKKYNFDMDNLVFNNSFPSKENGMVLYFEFNKKRDKKHM